MRNLKKFLALVLAMLMVVSASATVSAFSDVADDNQYATAIDDLVGKGIVNGVGDDKFNPEGLVERYQMALMMARALNPAESDWQAGMSIFSDVTEWNGAIAYAYMNKIVTGIGAGKFAPHDGIKYQDALIMAVRALGYTVDVSGDPYWLAAYMQAEKLGLTDGVNVSNGEKTLNRAETAKLIYNMLYATPADGGATIAAKNFGEATAENTTTFVLTATAKQAYAEVAKAADSDYVGVQALSNGVPTGDVVYLPVEIFGFTAAEADNYFGYAFDFVNYDAKTGSFDKIIPGLDPVVAYNSDITKNNSTKVTYDGVAYYPVEQMTGAALKNEIVVFNGGELASAAKMLLLNADGDIVNYNGTVVATFAYKTSTGVKYYADGSSSKVISEAAALEKYGVEIDDGTYTKYATLTADTLYNIGNYQITMFDDDRDGKYERAIVTPVFASVYYKKDSSGYEYTDGAWSTGANTTANQYITFTEALKLGDVFTYTYNSQTKVATVLDILAPQYGTLTKVNTTNVANTTVGSTYYAVNLTIDGTVYTLANATRQAKGFTGATLQNSKYSGVSSNGTISYFNNLYGLDNTGSSWNSGRPIIGFADYTALTAGSGIKYIAIDNQIIYAQTYDVDADYNRVVLNDIVSYDSDAVYLDLYIGGKLVEDVAVSKINGKTISNLNVFQLSQLLTDNALFKTGNVFRAVKLSDDTYQLSEVLVRSGANNNLTNFGLYDLEALTYKDALNNTFNYVDSTKTIVFNDGIADEYVTAAATPDYVSRYGTIRTSSSTVFYFIDKTDGSINAYVGAPDNSSINLAGTEVYVNKAGYAGDYAGVSSFVLVYYTAPADIKGFGISNVDESYIYVSTTSGYVDKYEKATAEVLGLGSDYTGTYYYYNNVDNLAVNMGNGLEVNYVYSLSKLEAGHFYSIDNKNVVKADISGVIQSADLKKADILQSRYYNIGTIVDQLDEVTTVKLAAAAFAGTIDTNSFGQLGDTAKTVKYIVDYEDGIFVGIVLPTVVTPPATVYTSNAKYDWNAKTCGAIATVSGDNAYATVQLYTDEVGIGNTVATKETTATAALNATYSVVVSKLNTTTNTYAAMTNVGVFATVTNGVMTVNKFVNAESMLEINLDAGSYKIEVSVDVGGNLMTVTYFANAN